MNGSPLDLASLTPSKRGARRPATLMYAVLALALAGLACAGGNEMPRDGGAGRGGSSGSGSGGSSGEGGASATTGAGGTSATTGAGGSSTTTGAGGSTAMTGAGGSTATTGAGGSTATTGAGGSTGAGGVTGTTGAGGTPGTTGAGGSSMVMPRVDLTNKKALIIVDNPTSLDDGDVLLQQILQVRGMVVTFGGATDGAKAAGQNVVIISSGETASIVTSFMTVAVPMLVFSNSYMQPLGLSPTGSANKGTIDGHTALAVTDTSTPLAAAMPMNMAVTALLPSRNASVYWGTPGGQAIKVLAVTATPTQGIVFAFEKGAMTATGTAPARRVAYAWKTNVLKDLTVDAFKLLSAGLDWTAGAP